MSLPYSSIFRSERTQFVVLVAAVVGLAIIVGATLCPTALSSPIAEKIAANTSRTTNLTQTTQILWGILLVATVFVPRRFILVPFLFGAFLIPVQQRLIIASIDFTTSRFLLFVLLARIILTLKTLRLKVNDIDIVVVGGFFLAALFYSLQLGTASAVLSRTGLFMDSVLVYLVFRSEIDSWDDVRRIFTIFAICALIIFPCVMYEEITGFNPFIALGALPAVVRDGKIRCMGPFSHPLMMGFVWAALIPMFYVHLRQKCNRILFTCALLAAAAMILTTRSSGPILMLLVMAALVPLFRLRSYFPLFAASALAGSLLLHCLFLVFFNKPIWYLLSKLDVTGSSTAWYRFWLIDTFVERFGDWWLFGYIHTGDWDEYGFLADITNQYILEAVNGGLVGLAAFLVLLFFIIRCLLKYSMVATNRFNSVSSWYLFVSVLGQLAGFLSVSIFGQVIYFWYVELAVIGFVFSQWSQEASNRSFNKVLV